MRTVLCSALLAGVLLAPSTSSAEDAVAAPPKVQALVTKLCVECHQGKEAEAGVDLSQAAALDRDSQLQVWNRVQDQLFFQLMPPADSRQPTGEERALLAGWFRAELRRRGASKLDEKLTYPEYGNYVDHDQLFHPRPDARPATPGRRWLVSPQIFHERVMNVFQLSPRERERFQHRAFYGVANPFVLPERSGVRDYDVAALDGGHLLVMLANADWIASKQIRPARVKHGELKADEFPDALDRWSPSAAPAAFEKIVLRAGPPTDAEIGDAVRTQFGAVLQRPPTPEELARYLESTRAAIQLGGNTEGLRWMLVGVLLESEFLYRLEFGEGEPDASGRRMLSPREAAFALSYALGDRGPDPQLLRAAAEGRLNSREDYRREAERLLRDQEYYRGKVDPSLDGKHIQSHVTSHPKIARFFREFFGYPAALKVFKDPPRSGGYYQNPDRGHAGTPGWLIQEADELLLWCLEKDQEVFETLLTTDRVFVYHNMDTKAGRECIASWKKVYETLRGEAWRTEPAPLVEQHRELLIAAKVLDPREKDPERRKREFLSYMYYFEDTFGQGRTPFTRGPFTHGYSYVHSPSYDLPPLPTRDRYIGVETARYKAPTDKPEYWDYPVEQPFAAARRKGMLTHPAWLVAHSTNFHSDPIRRGRWIREKLLAGSVPDVPITVDAQVPEDPHKTFRERVEGVTARAECRKCHQQMNPLGFPFESFDDFGRFRLVEALEHPDNVIRSAGRDAALGDLYKTKPVVAKGSLVGAGDPGLDGDVADAFDLIDRLARSERVRQSIVRHAFRFYLGRNETLDDGPTLVAADQAYVRSGGSFEAVILSLLVSDSFMYRTAPRE